MRSSVLLAVTIFAGCGVNPYLKFDSQEYQNFIVVKATADQARPKCGTAEVNVYALVALPHAGAVVQEYTIYRSTREVATAAQELTSLIDELRAAASRGMSKTYCERKLDNISNAAEKIAVTLAKKE